ncbi:autotransporter assembly complex protein TamA [Bartonella bilalgolemii]|uniref:Autotransporter assembly complex protein TamA n=1 Tax=Bartonella bilalgolemii TaxID=2942911 RepID=A0ABT0P6P7_9HYPH|nr:autotransporter assembly complex family protein [Bartonella sp. G70]MCL6229031.1 autotransporter assembly complex protein TamA [Bartonella sp. G70]
MKLITAYSVVVALCLIFTFTRSVVAFELFGFHLFGKKKSAFFPYGINNAEKSYTIEVVAPPGAPSEGIKIAKAASSLVSDQGKAVANSSGLLAKARSNYRTILAALYADGRYGGIISIKINGLEVSDLSPLAQLPAQSSIVITIDAGPQYVFNVANFNKDFSLENYKIGEILSVENLGYKVGAVAKSETVLKAERWLIERWRQHGYAKANIVNRDMVADHAARFVDAQITVNPGKKAYYGPLNVRNVSEQPRMDSAYIAWMTGLKLDQQYNPDALIKANKRLARLDVFRAVTLREAETISFDGHLPLTLILEERKPRRFGIGGSYSTLDGAGLEVYWMHNNLFGQAEHLKIETKISDIGSRKEESYHPKNFDYLLGATFIKPGIITPDTDFSAELKGEQDVLDNYTTTALKAQLGITHIFNDKLSGRVALATFNGYSRDDYFGNRHFTTIGLLSGMIYDGRNSTVNATKGLYSEAVLEPLYEMRFDNFVTKMTIEGRSYWAFDVKDHFIFSTRVKFGTIIGGNIAELPSDTLFFAGGGGSVRGYAYRNIGIKTENDTIVGGRSIVEGSAELRFFFNNKIGFVSFIDGGFVGEKTHFNFSRQMKWGVGIGGRYMTGFGPFRFDVAFPFKREKGDPRVGFYVGMGQAF